MMLPAEVGARVSERDRLLREKQQRDAHLKRGYQGRQVRLCVRAHACVCVCVCVFCRRGRVVLWLRARLSCMCVFPFFGCLCTDFT